MHFYAYMTLQFHKVYNIDKLQFIIILDIIFPYFSINFIVIFSSFRFQQL